MIKKFTPKQSWDFLTSHPDAVLIDVRTKIEHTHVGYPLRAINIPWKEEPDWKVNPRFAQQVTDAVASKTTPILLICRSGQRSMDAAKALDVIGFNDLINVEEGFEGSLDGQKHRGTMSGWRFHGLPWEQS